MRNYFVDGDWNALCDRCNFKKKASMLQLEWTGLRVCNECFETRHPQTLLHVPQEQINTPWARPPSDNTYYTVDWSYLNGVPHAILLNIDSSKFRISIPGYAPRLFADVNNDGLVDSTDAFICGYYGFGFLQDPAQLQYLKWMEQYMIANPSIYGSYLITNTYAP